MKPGGPAWTGGGGLQGSAGLALGAPLPHGDEVDPSHAYDGVKGVLAGGATRMSLPG